MGRRVISQGHIYLLLRLLGSVFQNFSVQQTTHSTSPVSKHSRKHLTVAIKPPHHTLFEPITAGSSLIQMTQSALNSKSQFYIVPSTPHRADRERLFRLFSSREQSVD